MEYALPLISLATAIVAVLWSTTDDEKKGMSRVRPAGWVLVCLAIVGCLASMALLDERREERELEQEAARVEARDLAIVRNGILTRCTSGIEFLLKQVCHRAKQYGWKMRPANSLDESERETLLEEANTGPYLKRLIRFRTWILSDPKLVTALQKLSEEDQKFIRDLAVSTRESLEKLEVQNESKVNRKLAEAIGLLKGVTRTVSVPLMLSGEACKLAVADIVRSLDSFSEILVDQWDEDAVMASVLEDNPEALELWEKFKAM